MSQDFSERQRLTMSYTIENWMITELELIGAELDVFGMVYAYEPISINIITEFFGKRAKGLRLAAQRLIEKYLLVVQKDHETLEIAPQIRATRKVQQKNVSAKLKNEAKAYINGAPSIMCANDSDAAWWYEAVDSNLSLVEREIKDDSNLQLNNVTLEETYKERANPFERRMIFGARACELKDAEKMLTEMQKGAPEECKQCAVFLLGEAERYDPFGNGRRIAMGKRKAQLEAKATELFETIWSEYPRKTAKAQALKTFLSKVKKSKDEFEITQKARKIYREMKRAITNWQNERDGEGRPIEFIPYFSSWLNDTI